LDFRSIETFLWVVKLGSFRGAAQRLNTTQPAISQRIAQLEREMHTYRASRGPGGIAPK
jgi:DNA-binding transcriptional LysR family regulator